MLYIPSEVCGLAGAEEDIIYLPGYPIDELPETNSIEFETWAYGVGYGTEASDTLTVCVIFNVTECHPFFCIDELW